MPAEMSVSQERARAAAGHKGPVLVVMRPQHHDATAATPTDTSSSRTQHNNQQQQKQTVAASEQPVSHSDEESLVPVPLPLGSVRVSLGPYSTFEDCYALVRFLVHTFREFEVYERDVAAGQKLVNVVDDAEHMLKLRAVLSLQ